MIRGIIFDCFGVLYVDVNRAYFANFPEHREELHGLNQMADHGFLGKDEYIRQAVQITGVNATDITEAFRKEGVANAELLQWIMQTLRSKAKIGLLSNVGRGWITDFFDEHQLHDMFDEVILSNEEGITKPNPLIFERAAIRLGLLPEECIMIDDRTENVEGAKEAGMRGLLYTSNEEVMQAVEVFLREKT